jgi:sirohydrochlorin ferrochelatase
MIEPGRAALVLAAHGDRGTAERNAVLRGIAQILADKGRFAAVFYGVLNGEPAVGEALRNAAAARPACVLVYPMFMSDGYFVKKVLPERIRVAASATVRLLNPLGLDPGLPEIILRRSLQSAKTAGFDPTEADLLLVGHGSKLGRASAEATEGVAQRLRAMAAFATVSTAFLEEEPFLEEAFARAERPLVVAGLFSGEGMHGHDDIPSAMERAAVPCIYTRPIGGDPAIAELIERAALGALSDLPT